VDNNIRELLKRLEKDEAAKAEKEILARSPAPPAQAEIETEHYKSCPQETCSHFGPKKATSGIPRYARYRGEQTPPAELRKIMKGE